jgi:glycosyltransferase involved in cell wall biosynthesis
LEPVFKVLDELADQYQFSFLVIGGSPIERQTKFPLQFSTWSLKTEITDLKKIDIGVMPLIDDEESRGKGGFKLLQYMGLGIVSIASPITINKDIVIHGKNSFLANGSEEWKRILESALKREINLVEIGSEARKRISSHFSFKAHKSTYVQFLNRICHEN